MVTQTPVTPPVTTVTSTPAAALPSNLIGALSSLGVIVVLLLLLIPIICFCCLCKKSSKSYRTESVDVAMDSLVGGDGNDVTLLEAIGRGRFAVVQHAQWQGNDVAVKVPVYV